MFDNIIEKIRINEHMEIADANGRHVGTVDEVEGDMLKLTRSDSADGRHHRLSLEVVDRVADNRVYLKQGAALPPLL